MITWPGTFFPWLKVVGYLTEGYNTEAEEMNFGFMPGGRLAGALRPYISQLFFAAILRAVKGLLWL